LQTSAEQVEGKLLPQAFPVLKDATDTVTIDGETYGYEISPLLNRAGHTAGQLIRLSPQISTQPEDQLYQDLEIRLPDLSYQATDGRLSISFQYLGDLIFQVTSIGYGNLESATAFYSAAWSVLSAAAQKQPGRPVFLLAQAAQYGGTTTRGRSYAGQQAVELLAHPSCGGVFLIHPSPFMRLFVRTITALASSGRLMICATAEAALAQIRRQQRQSVDQSEFLQWWQEAQETMQVGDQSLKVVRRPQ